MLLIKLRDFIQNLFESIFSCIKVIVLSKFILNFKLKSKKNHSLIVLGNGPSLNETLGQKEFLVDKELLCVNYFGRTDDYEKLQPSYYVITSLEYFFREEKEEFAVERKNTLEDIAKKTTWSLILFLPAKAKTKSHWKKIFKNNPNISIFYFNTTPVSGFNFFTNFCYKNNFGMPRPHNVLIPSLVLATNIQFSNIYICGADHSWLKELSVDSNNDVLLSQKHFYDNREKKPPNYKDMSHAKPMYHGGSTKTRKLHEILEKFYYTFRSYWKIKDYASSRNIKIYNITPESFIDAFERLDIPKNDMK